MKHLWSAVLLSALVASPSFAADKFLGWNCKDVAAMKAAMAKPNNVVVPFQKLSYAVSIAQVEDPAQVKTYDQLVKIVTETAAKHKIHPGEIAGAKMQQPYCKGIFIAEGYNASKNTNYQIHYLLNPSYVKTLKLQDKQLYSEIIAYLKKYKNITSVYQTGLVERSLQAIAKADASVAPAVALKDYQELRAIYSAVSAKSDAAKKQWAKVLAAIDAKLAAARK